MLFLLAILALGALSCSGSFLTWDTGGDNNQPSGSGRGMTTWAEDPEGNAQRTEGNIMVSVVIAGFSVLAAIRQVITKKDSWTFQSTIWLLILLVFNFLASYGAYMAWIVGPTMVGGWWSGLGFFGGLFGLLMAWAREEAVDVLATCVTVPFKWFFGRN